MQTMNQALADLYLRRLITIETAMNRSPDPQELNDIIARKRSGAISGPGTRR